MLQVKSIRKFTMKTSHIIVAAFAVITPMTLSLAPVEAVAKPVYVGIEGENIAVGGYDTVSYFRGNGVPEVGSSEFKAEHDGAVYHFANAENLAAFQDNPAMFLPQYGGHCAWAMSRGSLAPGDPTVYKIVDGKLYLNFNKQVQKTWLTDIAGFITKADAQWLTIPDDAKFGN